METIVVMSKGALIIITMIVSASLLSTVGVFNRAYAITGISTPSPLSLVNLSNLGLNPLDSRLLTLLLQLNGSKIFSEILNGKCIASALTGGSPSITKTGNLIFGTACDDVIRGDDRGDIIIPAGGNDVVYGGRGNDIVYSGAGDDRLYGKGGNDILVAGAGTDLLDGGPGNDALVGGAGNSIQIGGAGNDVLIGGAGTTIMVGGPGANKFDCGAGVSTGIVLDYNPAQGDIISGQCKIVSTVSNPNNLPNTIPSSS
jgi:hypothetical protein